MADAGSLAESYGYRVIRPDIIRVSFCVRRKERVYQKLLDKLTELNRWYRRNGFPTPLYETGVRYCGEPKAHEVWQSIPVLYLNKLGDCEDLAPARASEIDGARAILKKVDTRPNGARLYHIITRLPNGQIEDPSKRLGMKG